MMEITRLGPITLEKKQIVGLGILAALVIAVTVGVAVMSSVPPQPTIRTIEISDKQATIVFADGHSVIYPGTCEGKIRLVTDIGGQRSDQTLQGCAPGAKRP